MYDKSDLKACPRCGNLLSKTQRACNCGHVFFNRGSCKKCFKPATIHGYCEDCYEEYNISREIIAEASKAASNFRKEDFRTSWKEKAFNAFLEIKEKLNNGLSEEEKAEKAKQWGII